MAAPVIWIKIKDTTALEEDLKFSDATVEEVAPTAVVEEKRAAARGQCWTDVAFWGGVIPGNQVRLRPFNHLLLSMCPRSIWPSSMPITGGHSRS